MSYLYLGLGASSSELKARLAELDREIAQLKDSYRQKMQAGDAVGAAYVASSLADRERERARTLEELRDAKPPAYQAQVARERDVKQEPAAIASRTRPAPAPKDTSRPTWVGPAVAAVGVGLGLYLLWRLVR